MGEREFVLGVSVLLAQYLVVVQNGSQRRRLPLLRARQLAKRLNADGPIDPPHAWTLAEDVAERFAAA